MFKRFQLFSNQLYASAKKHQNKIENTSAGIIWAACSGYYLFNLDNIAKREVDIFKSRLTPEERIEMESSPEKNRQYKERCKDEIRRNHLL